MSYQFPAGYISHAEMGMRFVLWASQLRRWPTYRDVMAAFGVSRATAHRYLNAYRNVVSVDEASRRVA